MTDPGPGPDTKRRGSMARVAGVGVLSAALGAVAAAKPWVRVHQGSTELHSGSGELGGVDLGMPLAAALALVALAGWGVLLVTRGRARRVIAAIALLAAVGVVVCGVVGLTGLRGDVRRALASASAADRLSVGLGGWIWVALVASVLTAATLALAVRDAPSWPAMGSRYDAPAAARRPDEPTGDAGAAQWWKSLDEGDDPTAPH